MKRAGNRDRGIEGLGRALAEGLAAARRWSVVMDGRDAETLQTAADELRALTSTSPGRRRARPHRRHHRSADTPP